MNRALITAFNLALVSPLLHASSISSVPDGFQDFFTKTSQAIHVTIAGDKGGEEVVAMVDYESFSILESSESYKTLETFLQRKGLTASAIKQILNDVLLGVSTDSQCTGRLSRCVLDTSDGKSRYVFDFDNSQLKLFIAPSALRNNLDEVEYESSLNQQNAIINWSNLYAYTDFRNQEQLTLSNETTIGLPLGHVKLDTEYTSIDGDFEVYTALYDAEYKSVRLQAGRNRYNPSFNSTDYLNNGASYSGDAFHIGTSANLLKGKKNAQQRIYFYAPQNAQLEVYRDERLILNKVVSEGKQYVSYADLPKGAYTATLILKVSGETILTETRQVVNNNQFALNNGELDYVIGVGQLEKQKRSQSEQDNEQAKRKYMRGMANYRLNEHTLVAGGITNNGEDQFYQLGTSLILSEGSSLEYTGGVFSAGDTFQTGRLSYAPFFVDYRQLKLDELDDTSRLVNQLYGKSSYTSAGVGLSGNVLGGSGYLRYNWRESNELEKRSNQSQMLSGGWSYRLPKGRLNLSADYTDVKHHNDEVRAAVSYTLELGSGVSSQFSVYANKDGFDKNSNYLRMNNKWGDWYNNASVGAHINRNNQISSDVSSSLNGHTDTFNVSAYGYANDQGIKSASGGISGTQVLSFNGVDFTNKKGRSFAKVKKHYQGEATESSVQLSLSKDNTYSQRRELTAPSTLLRLDDFTQVQLEVDEGSNNVLIEGKRLNAFALPGSVYQLDSNVIELLSQILVLDDINGKPIDSLQCIGNGCVSVEPLSSDGVYRINYQQGSVFRLVSRKGLCVYDEQESEGNYNYGYCLPGLENTLDNELDEAALLFESAEGQEALTYIGLFHVGAESKMIIKQLEERGIHYKSVEVAGQLYVYLSEGQALSQKQKDLLKELDAYVLHRGAEEDLLTQKLRLGNEDDV